MVQDMALTIKKTQLHLIIERILSFLMAVVEDTHAPLWMRVFR